MARRLQTVLRGLWHPQLLRVTLQIEQSFCVEKSCILYLWTVLCWQKMYRESCVLYLQINFVDGRVTVESYMLLYSCMDCIRLAPHRPYIWALSIYYISLLWYDRHPRAALGRTEITREVDRKSPTYVHMLASANFTVSSCCIFRQSATVAVSFDIGSLQYGFYKSSTRLRYKSATRLHSTNPGITDERDSFNEGGSERRTTVTQRQRYKGRNG